MKHHYPSDGAGEPDKTWAKGMYLRLYEAKGLLSKEIQKFCLAMPCDHPEDHMHRCRVGDEEDYERTKMAEISLAFSGG